MNKVLVLGANGSLGKAICKELANNKIIYFGQTRSKKNKFFSDFIDKKNFLKLLNTIKPNIVINTISNIDVDECENDKFKCFNDNILTAHIVSSVCGLKKIKQIYISTDQVYSNTGASKEKNANPLNNYGRSKIIAERFVLKNKGSVLRVNFIHKDKKLRTFHDKIINKKINKIFLYKNIFFNPLHISTLANIIVQNLNSFNCDAYNIGSKNKISKKDFIVKICNILKLKRKFKSVNYSSKIIPRPLDMTMNISKICRLLKNKKYDVNEEIHKLCKEYI